MRGVAARWSGAAFLQCCLLRKYASASKEESSIAAPTSPAQEPLASSATTVVNAVTSSICLARKPPLSKPLLRTTRLQPHCYNLTSLLAWTTALDCMLRHSYTSPCPTSKQPHYADLSQNHLNTATTFAPVVLASCGPCLPIQRRPPKTLHVIYESSSLDPSARPGPSPGRAVTSPSLSRTSTTNSFKDKSRRGSGSDTPRSGQPSRKPTLAEKVAYIEANPVDKGPWHPDSAYYVPKKS